MTGAHPTTPFPAVAVHARPAPTPVVAAPTAPVVLASSDADVLAALVLACPAVAGLSGGPLGSAVTYLPGHVVPGLRIRDDTVEIHPILACSQTVRELARQVRLAVAGHVGQRSVDIVVEDVDLPGEDPAPQRPAESAPSLPTVVPVGQVLDPQTPAAARSATDRLDDHPAVELLPGSGSPSEPSPSEPSLAGRLLAGRATPTVG